ncbi:MAG: MarR family winged helix-turn-helix transcriptional regulator [Candidatus Aenigmatarchaeota archaeon]
MVTKKSLVEVLFKDKPLKVLLVLSDGIPKNITQIYKKVRTTYSHTLNILKVFYELELIEFEKMGRDKVVRLSKKGEKIIEIIKKFLGYLD